MLIINIVEVIPEKYEEYKSEKENKVYLMKTTEYKRSINKLD